VSVDELTLEPDALLQNQGIPAGLVVPAAIEALCATALSLLSEVAAPAGVLLEISKPDFEVVYEGEGRNEARTPVGDIFGRADGLSLFVVTLGERVSREIEERFRAKDLALGAMLDAAASVAADKLAEIAESRFLEALLRTGRATPSTCVLCYSPGYCGWHVSGQKRLFEILHPEQIGVTLRDSFLMQPLKSVSGVLIAGPKEIHSFEMSYPFCSECETQGCRARIRALRAD
ncbi:MAG: vitamin B12 dependent-methionine synthase activation domain-containing protein, partial [Phycisphaerae bacterium]